MPKLRIRPLGKMPKLRIRRLGKMPKLRKRPLGKMPKLRIRPLGKMPKLRKRPLGKMPKLWYRNGRVHSCRTGHGKAERTSSPSAWQTRCHNPCSRRGSTSGTPSFGVPKQRSGPFLAPKRIDCTGCIQKGLKDTSTRAMGRAVWPETTSLP